MRELPVMVPRATYFALAPFIGAEAAGAVATAAVARRLSRGPEQRPRYGGQGSFFEWGAAR